MRGTDGRTGEQRRKSALRLPVLLLCAGWPALTACSALQGPSARQC